MKKILYLLGVLITLAMSSTAQPVKPQMDGGEIKDLKELVFKYCTIELYFESSDLPSGWKASIETEKRSLYFVTKETGEIIKFYDRMDLFNFMYREGWKFVNSLSPYRANGNRDSYLFEKIEK